MIIFLGIKLHDILFSPYYSSASKENKKISRLGLREFFG